MSLDWNKVAVAVASRVQYEQSCGRGRLISEDVTRLALAEVVQSQVAGDIEAEFNHPDIPGNARLDLLVRSPRVQNIDIAIEHKWVRSTSVSTTRHWAAEILGDILRVERLQQNMSQGCERAIVVVGEVDVMRTKVWERTVQQGGGQQRLRVVDAIIQGRPASGTSHSTPLPVSLRASGQPFRRLIRQEAEELYRELPSFYQIRLAAFHRTMSDGIECVVWIVTRGHQQRITFDASAVWPSV
jgi:hypothetical protein